MIHDRFDAGRQLGHALRPLRDHNPVVIGMSRGGVLVAQAIAQVLQAPMDVLLVHTIGDPAHAGLEWGVVCENGAHPIVRLSDASQAPLPVMPAGMEHVISSAIHDIAQRADMYRSGRSRIALAGRTVILVDDAVQTGFRARAAIEALRIQGARRVILAVPTGATSVIIGLQSYADAVVCLAIGAASGQSDQADGCYPPATDDDVMLALHPRTERDMQIIIDGGVLLTGHLHVPRNALMVVLVINCDTSAKDNLPTRAFARHLQAARQGTLLMDVLTPAESEHRTASPDIKTLTARVKAITRWLHTHPETQHLPVAYFASGAGAGPALVAAANGMHICAVVTAAGHPDLAGQSLRLVHVPTLMIVGANDSELREITVQAARMMPGTCQMSVIDGASKLAEYPGGLSAVSDLAVRWFAAHTRQPVSA